MRGREIIKPASGMHRWIASALLLAAFVAPVRADNKTGAESIAVAPTVSAPTDKETAAQHDARMAWWREAKFGLFIHWGVYAVPAGKYGNITDSDAWIMYLAKIPVQDYRAFSVQFNPVKYNPELWTKIAKNAGMRYIVITAKHHDGFALYPSKVSDWNITDASPYKKDLLGPLVNAAHRDGLKIGFYYSQAQDWVHRGGAKGGRIFKYEEGGGWDDAQKGSFDDYLKNIAVPQVREILTGYPIDILWWDTPKWMNAQRAAPLAALTTLRPGLITNNRLGPGFAGDTSTPEQFIPVLGYRGDWETCMTMNDHWGYNALDTNWKSSADLIRKLAETCSKGGNLLLNVGPTAEGEFPQPCVERLQEVGRWLKINSDSIYGTHAGPFFNLSWGCATRKDNRLYLHVFKWPLTGQLLVPLQSEAKAAWLLTSPDTPLKITREPNRLAISVPNTAPDPTDTVVVLELNGEPAAVPLPTVGASATATGSDPNSAPENILDGTDKKYWLAPKDVKSASVEIDLVQDTAIAGFGFDEPGFRRRMSQTFTLEAMENKRWIKIAEGKTEGFGFKGYFQTIIARKFRITMTSEEGIPALAEVQLYRPE